MLQIDQTEFCKAHRGYCKVKAECHNKYILFPVAYFRKAGTLSSWIRHLVKRSKTGGNCQVDRCTIQRADCNNRGCDRAGPRSDQWAAPNTVPGCLTDPRPTRISRLS